MIDSETMGLTKLTLTTTRRSHAVEVPVLCKLLHAVSADLGDIDIAAAIV